MICSISPSHVRSLTWPVKSFSRKCSCMWESPEHRFTNAGCPKSFQEKKKEKKNALRKCEWSSFYLKNNSKINPVAIKIFLRKVCFNVVRHVGLLPLLMLIYRYSAFRGCFQVSHSLSFVFSYWMVLDAPCQGGITLYRDRREAFEKYLRLSILSQASASVACGWQFWGTMPQLFSYVSFCETGGLTRWALS